MRSHVGREGKGGRCRGRESASRAVSVYRMYGNARERGMGIAGAKGISSRPPDRLARNWKRILGF